MSLEDYNETVDSLQDLDDDMEIELGGSDEDEGDFDYDPDFDEEGSDDIGEDEYYEGNYDYGEDDDDEDDDDEEYDYDEDYDDEVYGEDEDDVEEYNVDEEDYDIDEDYIDDNEINNEIEEETDNEDTYDIGNDGGAEETVDDYVVNTDNNNVSDENDSNNTAGAVEALGDDYVGVANDGEVVYDDRESVVDGNGNVIVMSGNSDEAFEFKYIDINNIVVADRIRRNNNSEALTTSIKNTGLLMPVIVAPTATEGVYALINGLKRLISCAKSGIRRIPCVINKNAKTTELRILEAMYNHSTPYSIREMLDFIEYLEKERNILNPSTIEYLLQMETGDYTKLKDIMNDGDENIVTPLLNGQMTIAQAFKKLESRRKKETREEKENRKASDVYSDTEESGASAIDEVGEIGDENVQLSPEELSELGFTADELDKGLEDENLEDMIAEGKNMEGYEPHKQDWKNRERLDPVLRKAVLARDNNTSRVDPSISGQEYTECLDVHHIHEVYLGGSDDIDNLITVDIISHKLIHLYARGELHIGNLETMSEEQKEKFKRIIKLGNVIREDMKARGMKIEELKKVDDADTIGRTKPGTGQVAG